MSITPREVLKGREKPRIRRAKDGALFYNNLAGVIPMYGVWWVCSSDCSNEGWGRTPREAFEHWDTITAYRIVKTRPRWF